MNKARRFLKRFTLMLLVLTLAVGIPALAQAGEVSGRVYSDLNGNKKEDTQERGLSSVVVRLIMVKDQVETEFASVQTDAKGNFGFAKVEAGQYYLDIRLPKDTYFIDPMYGGSAALPAQGNHGRTPLFEVKEGDAVTLPVGTTKRPAYFNFVAFEDVNRNGSRYSTEPFIKDVEVTILFDFEGQTYEIAKGRTNLRGFAQFRYLTPATYHLRATLPAPYNIGPRGAKDTVFFNVFTPSGEREGVAGPYLLETMRGLGISGIQ